MYFFKSTFKETLTHLFFLQGYSIGYLLEHWGKGKAQQYEEERTLLCVKKQYNYSKLPRL